jgi:hypothetical protein
MRQNQRACYRPREVQSSAYVLNYMCGLTQGENSRPVSKYYTRKVVSQAKILAFFFMFIFLSRTLLKIFCLRTLDINDISLVHVS